MQMLGWCQDTDKKCFKIWIQFGIFWWKNSYPVDISYFVEQKELKRVGAGIMGAGCMSVARQKFLWSTSLSIPFLGFTAQLALKKLHHFLCNFFSWNCVHIEFFLPDLFLHNIRVQIYESLLIVKPDVYTIGLYVGFIFQSNWLHFILNLIWVSQQFSILDICSLWHLKNLSKWTLIYVWMNTNGTR